ncbi:MAG: heavy-metal-associated domain-containing protein [bacterium]
MRTVTIRGMSCAHCVAEVTRVMEGIEGVEEIAVDLKTGKVTFEETAPVDMETVRERIEEAGYEIAE